MNKSDVKRFYSILFFFFIITVNKADQIGSDAGASNNSNPLVYFSFFISP